MLLKLSYTVGAFDYQKLHEIQTEIDRYLPKISFYFLQKCLKEHHFLSICIQNYQKVLQYDTKKCFPQIGMGEPKNSLSFFMLIRLFFVWILAGTETYKQKDLTVNV